MSKIDEVRALQRAKADTIRKKFYYRHQQDICRWSFESDDDEFLQTITRGHLDDRLLLCNSWVRKYAAYAWIDAWLADFTREPDRDRFWITLAWDTPLTWERKPEIDTRRLRNIANQHLRRCDLDGAGVVEIDTWKEIAGEPGKRISPHVHFLGHMQSGEKIAAEELEEMLRARRALGNSLGAPSVKVKNVGKTAKDLATLGFYMSKLPAYAKNPVPSRVRSGYDLIQVNHAPGSVTRLVEVLSYLELGDEMFAIGEGKHITAQVRAEVRERCARKSRAVSAPTRDEIARHWRRIRSINGNRNFADCNVFGRAHQRCVSEEDD